MPDIVFTVFTATFNRAHTLDRLFASLEAQTFRAFEWVVIDDGSTDGTAAKLADYRSRARFPVTAERQENQGKHVAHNRAVGLARGELFVIADSDDELTPDALETFHRQWSALTAEERREFYGVSCHCRDGATGRVLGRPPASPVKVPALEYILREGIDVDLASCARTDVMREHLFPALEGVKLIPEGAVWNRIMRRYRMVLMDRALEVKHYQADGYTRNLRASYVRHAAGRYWHFLTNLRENSDLLLRHGKRRWLKDLIQLGRMMIHAGKGIGETRRELPGSGSRVVFLLMLPAAWWLARGDRSTVLRSTV